MRNDGAGNGETLHDGLEWVGMFGLGQTSDMVWRCEATRAGRLYSRTLFDTRDEAEDFVRSMRQAEPDQMFSVEAIKASAVWN